MAISNQANINIGLPNEAANSDSLYTAFSKTQNNFNTLFSYASPYNTYTGGTGITACADPSSNTVTITNTGVTSLNAGTGVTLSGNTGCVTISLSGGGGGGGTVTSVDVVGAGPNPRITSSYGPVVSSGTIVLDLATTGVTSGTYTYPTLTVDDYGRINNISNGTSVGTVTSVGVIAGPGMLVTGSPVTTSGDITIVNAGVVRLNAGTGIALTDNTGNITISTAQGVGTVTSIDIVSSTLNISGAPIVSSGSVIIDLPNDITISGNATVQNIIMPDDSDGFFTGTGQILTANGYASIYSYGSGMHGGPELDWSNTDDLTAFMDSTVTRNTMYLNGDGLYVGLNENSVIGLPQKQLVFDSTTGNFLATGNIVANENLAGHGLIVSGSEDLTNGAAASLTEIASYFSTTGAWTATLAAGTNGQMKTFMMAADGGDMVITVTNAGWKSSGTGTITFNDIGDGCTLQYINSKWYCIGQNGVTFG